MKTSTKLLIVLFSCLPLSMVAYGYFLKQQFNAGNFYQEIYLQNKERVFKAIPAFNHLVIDGNLYVFEESSLTKKDTEHKKIHYPGSRTVSMRLESQVEITGTGKTPGLSILAKYQDIVKTKIGNDTLYISFFKLNGEKIAYTIDALTNILSVNNKHLKSAELNTGNFSIVNLKGKELAVKTKNSFLRIEGSGFDQLILNADASKPIEIDNNTISVLQYSLQNNSKLNLGKNEIKNFQKLSADSLSKISVQGYASDMEKFLPVLSK